ncbi:hypothetical protein [Escherichia phage dw-ec]|nr:hypothetical protein [Escherichia phage dw-ec]WPK30606.1 hypothetical protein ETECTG_CDS0091 [Escherichia phage ETEC-TG]
MFRVPYFFEKVNADSPINYPFKISLTYQSNS